MLDPIADNMAWAMVEKHKKTETKQILNTWNDNKVAVNDFDETPIKGKKRKEITPQKPNKIKISKTQSISIDNASEIEVNTQSLVPSGTEWHQKSCAYDAILCIVHTIWASHKDRYTEIFNLMNNDIMHSLASNFIKHASGEKTVDSTRDDM